MLWCFHEEERCQTVRYGIFFILFILLFSAAGCSEKPSQPSITDQQTAAEQPLSTEQPRGTEQPTSTEPSPVAEENVWPALKLVEAYPNVSFNQPLEFLPAPDGSNRVFIVEKSGKIYTLDNDPEVKTANLFLDLSSRVDSSASEKGLLGMAFHPRFEENGFFYVNYTNRSQTVIARYTLDRDPPLQPMIQSEQVLLTIPQPYQNHNGGHLDFGPDGYLYIGTGDGGSAGDPQGQAQNLKSLLGKILRIDVDQNQNGDLYSIPLDNPLEGNLKGYREEIYAYGFRNPWKFCFDLKNSRLWVADVGQNTVEEIDIVEKGLNYGWNRMEGSLCYPPSNDCSKEGLQLPIWEYKHPLGKSITGGYPYYGNRIAGLSGTYVYGDFVTGLIWGLRLDHDFVPENKLLIESNLKISSFGIDQNNEIYILDFQGKIYKFQEIIQ